MSLTASSSAAVSPAERVEVLFEELAELAGQRNAIDGRIVEIVAELDRDELCGATGARSVAALVAWKLGWSSGNAHTIATVASRLAEFPRCAAGMREGRLSLDQVGVIAARAGEGSDEHYAQLAACATVNQLRTAVKLEPRPEPDSRPQPQPSITKTCDEHVSCWRITLGHLDAAKFDAALASHRDALIAEWKHDRGTSDAHLTESSPVAEHRRGVHAPSPGRMGRRGGPAATRAAHHRGGARRCGAARRRAASGPAAHRRRTPIPDL